RGLRPGAARGGHPALLLRPLQPHRRHARLPRRVQRHLRRGRPLDGGPRREDLRRRDDQPRPRLPDRRVPDPPRVRRTPADALREPEQPEGGRRPPLPVLRLPATGRARVRLAGTGGRHRRRLTDTHYEKVKLSFASVTVSPGCGPPPIAITSRPKATTPSPCRGVGRSGNRLQARVRTSSP